MKISQQFLPVHLPPFNMDSSAILVDFNIPAVTLEEIVKKVEEKEVRLFIEPTSLFKIEERCHLLKYAEVCFPNLEVRVTIFLL